MIKQDTPQVVGEIIAMVRELEGVDVIVIDETGIGGGVVDMCREAQKTDTISRNTEIRGVQFGAGFDADEIELKEKYVNLKARMFGLLSDDLKAQDGLTLPHEDVYLDELPTILYRYDSKGRMFIESKDEYKKRTGRKSPDFADSLALANFGRYDEKTTGRFTEEFSSQTNWSKPFAASLNSRRDY